MTPEEWRADCWRRLQESKTAALRGDFDPGNRMLKSILAKHGKEAAAIARRELTNYVERGK